MPTTYQAQALIPTMCNFIRRLALGSDAEQALTLTMNEDYRYFMNRSTSTV